MKDNITIGIVAAPELATDIANKLVTELPRSLKKHIAANTDWNIETVTDPLTGAVDTVEEIFNEALIYRKKQTWDYIICLTDLPIFHGNKVVAVDINESIGISLISLPSFGWRPILKRVQKTIVQAVDEVHRSDGFGKKGDNSEEGQQLISSSKLLRRQFPISPVRKIRVWMEETNNLHTRFLVIPRINGTTRLLSGMTFANNPFKMMSSLTNVIAIAFTTGAFGIIFDTMWKLSHLFSTLRMVSITVVAILGMVLWVILAHELWEPLSKSRHKNISILYNLTTVLTLIISICAYYSIVFLLFFGTSTVLIPPEFLAKKLELNHVAGITNYMKVAWFATSISTVAGAIGAGLENEELVRDSTYGYRQNRRYQEIHEQLGE